MPANLQLQIAPSTSRAQPPVRKAPDEFAALDRLGSVVSLQREAVLFHESDSAEHYFKVVTGAVRCCKFLADGRRHVSEFYLPGDFIGLDAESAYQFTAEAVTETTVVRYTRRSVEALAAQEPRFGRRLLSIACHGLSAAQQKLVLLGRKTAEERIATFLLDIADRCGETECVSLPMSRTDIGDHLGLTMETVSRGLSHLKSEGVIALESSHKIRIRDRDVLEEIADAA
ncbi:MAG TPA: helix-turn-helix domain-containing protein [Stellaceae bacterium]|nr:helix-turn-helix domain-containing protein [Stellaceae bacterium]